MITKLFNDIKFQANELLGAHHHHRKHDKHHHKHEPIYKLNQNPILQESLGKKLDYMA